MKRPLLPRIILALTLIVAAAAQDAAVFEAGTTQVRIDVLVSNGKGPIAGLKAEDFVVTDNGQPVTLNYAGTGEEPLNILLLLDVSGSMKGYLDQIAKRARSVLDLLRETDKVGVMVFSKDTDYYRPFTPDKDRAANAIDQALLPSQLPAGTAINAALLDAGDAFAEATSLRGYRSVFILTDNKSLNYRAPDDAVLEKLFGQDVVLNAIVTKNAEPPKKIDSANPDFSFADVFKLSAQTGGEVLRTDRADEAFAQLLRNMRQRYLLTYRAPAGESKAFRSVKVELTKAARKRYGKVVIRARAGYFSR
jgi:VWFA-related protein